jgi:hypothetical protein
MAHFLRKEGKHFTHDQLEFWAEDGLIFIEDRRVGDFNIVSCYDFALRARALNKEAKRAKYQVDRDNLNDWVCKMHECWKEAKTQGDPMDPEIARQKYRERRKQAALILPSVW